MTPYEEYNHAGHHVFFKSDVRILGKLQSGMVFFKDEWRLLM
jgi:hypothetical protein